MTVRVIIQSRLSSTRLPAKGLLPIAGMPSVVLCALRAANRGHDVLVATSIEASDDITAEVLREEGIRYIRGSLNNVLDRFCHAAQDLMDDDIVVRLTADNLFPDGEFIEELINQFISENLKYLGTQSPLDGLPYGLSAEIFNVGTLRHANKLATSSFDREHVTPWIKRMYGSSIFKVTINLENIARLRCTMDSFQDYLRMLKVFNLVENPITESWMNLCIQLARISGRENFQIPYRLKNGNLQSELTLGTAQLGLNYGIANNLGMPILDEALSIVQYAIDHGLTHIDSARAYGEAEKRIGKALTNGYAERVNIITKLDPLVDTSILHSTTCLRKAVDASVFQSCRELRAETIQTLLLHRWEHRYLKGGEIWKRLLELKQDGVINTLGVSVQTPEEAILALAESEVGHIQIPFNILDWRWKKKGIDKAILMRGDVVVHTRSTLLQGLLATNDVTKMPNTPDELTFKINRKLDDLVQVFQRDNRTDLCFAYVRAQTWIDSIVIGVETLDQLKENIALFQNPPLTGDECAVIENVLMGAPTELLDPSKW